MKGLTLKQQHILEFIEEFSETMHMAPTIYEIAAHFEIKPSTVFTHIGALVKKGVLVRSGKARSILITEPYRHRSRPVDIQTPPIAVKGSKRLKNLRLDLRFFPQALNNSQLFAQKIQDGALPDVGIFPGDMLLLQKYSDSVIQPGDLLLIEEDGKPTVCRCLTCCRGKIEMTDHVGRRVSAKTENLAITGVVIGLQRKY